MQSSSHILSIQQQQPSPLSYVFNLDNDVDRTTTNMKGPRNRSCLPGYSYQSSTTNSSNTEKMNRSTQQQQQPSITSSLTRSKRHSESSITNQYHHSSMGALLLPDEMAMMDHMSIVPSPSLPTTATTTGTTSNSSYHYSRPNMNSKYRCSINTTTTRRQSESAMSSSLASSSRFNGTTPLRRPRNTTSSISRSATAALANPTVSSSSSSRGGRNGLQYYNSNHHHHHHHQQQQHGGVAASSESPSKRSSSQLSTRVSISSQVSSTTPISNYDDDNGTVSTKRSENSIHRYYNNNNNSNGNNSPSPMQLLNTTTSKTTASKSQRRNDNTAIIVVPSHTQSTNHSVGSSTATKSSSGTNTMGNTTSAKLQHRYAHPSKTIPTMSPSKQAVVDVDAMKRHIHDTRIVIDDLYQSQGSTMDHRQRALSNACLLFNHTIEHLHNIELTNGALPVISTLLFLHIQQYLPRNNATTTTSHNKHNDEILYLILSAMEMLSRSASSILYNAYCKIKLHYHNDPNININSSDNISKNEGGIYFVHCMFRLLDRFESYDTGNTDESNKLSSNITNEIENSNKASIAIVRNFECIHCIGRILISLLRSSEFRSIFFQPDHLFQKLIQESVNEVAVSDGTRSKTMDECRLCRLHILSNLITYCGNEQREILYRCDGLIDTLLRYCNFDPIITIRQAASSCILELTNAPSNCIEMAQNKTVIGTMVKMILLDERTSSTVSTTTLKTSVSTRESALTALQNIAFDRVNRPHLVQFKNGLVLEALKKTLTSDIDAKARRRAAGTVVNLIGEETAECIVAYKGLVDTLALVATQDDNTDVQTRAALSITKLAVHIADHLPDKVTEPTTNYLTALDALVVTSLSKVHCARVTAVIRNITRNHPDHRPILARHDGIVDTLTDIIQAPINTLDKSINMMNDEKNNGRSPNDASNVSDRTNAIHALAHLSHSDDTTRKYLCNRPTLLTAIVVAAQTRDTQDMAILVLERLATVTSNRYTMAHCSGLIIVVAEAVERESRREKKHDKNAIANGKQQEQKPAPIENRCDDDDRCTDDEKFAQKGSSCYLAKPLLMSLLVAM